MGTKPYGPQQALLRWNCCVNPACARRKSKLFIHHIAQFITFLTLNICIIEEQLNRLPGCENPVSRCHRPEIPATYGKLF